MIMERVGMEDGVPIENKLTSRAIENAQKKVEAHNFDIRKHLLEFDDVMNKQREVVYSQRRFILGGDNLKETAQDMTVDVVEDIVDRYADDRAHFEDWDLAALSDSLWGQFGMRFNFTQVAPEQQNREAITEYILNAVQKRYDQKETELKPETMRELEKFIMLQAVDTQWKDHLLSMDHLKDGIGLRGYGQRDPLKEYQKEGYEMFLDMSLRIKEETVRNLFLVRLRTEDELQELTAERDQEMQLSHGDGMGDSKPKTIKRQAAKVGRNDPCPCGSGKKYKKCCGKAA